jgi:magnesium-transporting ATPase (P-type)
MIIFWLLVVGLGLVVATIMSKNSFPNMIMSAFISAICYVGILLFVTVSVAKSLRNQQHH